MKKLIFIIFTFFVCIQGYAQNGHYADVNGSKIYYEMYGEGYPLVLLHGFTMSHEMWEEAGWVQELSNKYRLILVDLRGHGHSTNPSNTFTHHQSAEDIYTLMDILGINQFKAIGFSSGGMTLTHMAVMDSSRIEAMVLIGSTSYFPDQTRSILRSISYETIDAEWLNNLQRWHPRGETQIRSLITQFKSFADTYNDMNFTPPYLSQIKAPTLIIHGDRDSFFPVDIPITSFKHIPDSYLWVVPNFGHSGIVNDSIWGEAFIGAINQFLSGEWND